VLDSCARDATDEAAYVARLTLEDADSSNAETWIDENLSSCGVYSADGVSSGSTAPRGEDA
jgi:hypothetical protein